MEEEVRDMISHGMDKEKDVEERYRPKAASMKRDYFLFISTTLYSTSSP
jgi:hypothetical protein